MNVSARLAQQSVNYTRSNNAGPDEVYDEFNNRRSDDGPDAVVDEFDNSRSRGYDNSYNSYDSYSGGGGDYIGGMFLG